MLKNERMRRGPAERMWAPIKLNLDKDYNYVTKNWGLRFLYYFAMFVGMPFVYLYYSIRYGLKIYGKHHVRELGRQSVITVANHVHNTDSFMLTRAFYPNTPYFVALRHNFEAFIVGGLVRVMRGIPLPEDVKNFERFSAAIGDLLKLPRRRLHMYPEGEILPYSRELRSFKNGAFHFAVKNNVPVLPMVFVFPAKKKICLLIGEPIYMADVPHTEGISGPKQTVLLRDYTKAQMQRMMDEYYGPRGIDTKERAI